MAEHIKDNIVFMKAVEIIITPQAQMVIASTKYSMDEFQAWALEESKISLGGNNATIFLEKMYKKEVEKNGSTNS